MILLTVPFSLSGKQLDALNTLAELGLWGGTAQDVCCTLIEDGLRRLYCDGVLPVETVELAKTDA